MTDRIVLTPHTLKIANFHTPKYCAFCGEFIWGVARQGYKCRMCGIHLHRRCADRALAETSCPGTKKLLESVDRAAAAAAAAVATPTNTSSAAPSTTTTTSTTMLQQPKETLQVQGYSSAFTSQQQQETTTTTVNVDSLQQQQQQQQRQSLMVS